jgi:hypothetical protein
MRGSMPTRWPSGGSRAKRKPWLIRRPLMPPSVLILRKYAASVLPTTLKADKGRWLVVWVVTMQQSATNVPALMLAEYATDSVPDDALGDTCQISVKAPLPVLAAPDTAVADDPLRETL